MHWVARRDDRDHVNEFQKDRECIRKLNPGGKGRRCRFRRGGTKTSSKTVKGSHFDHRSGSWRTGFISQPQNQNHLKKQIEQTAFHFHDFSKRSLMEKLENCVPPNVKTIRKAHKLTMDGRERGRRQVTLCCQKTTVHFSVAVETVRD